ncbi:MAG: COX15/CtaA family protein [candidate division KSB1 bacterium]|nr:COX15/CtaA family protein [candidate division KSB1 bacterium]
MILTPSTSAAAVDVPATGQAADRNKRIARWLFWVSASICIMVVVGGLVRLTYSGLSITEWKVITGVLPPLTQEQWLGEFQKYQQTPQYQKLFPDMTLSDFKFIYYMEWFHRLLGRIVGLLFAIPFFVYWARGWFQKNELPRFVAIGLLFMFQGFFGWYMVQSGLVDRPLVSHYRLTIHLLLALVLLTLAFHTGLYFWRKDHPLPRLETASALRFFIRSMPVLLFVQFGLGGLVAGLKAGVVSDTFPKMAGAWIPDLIYSMQPWYKNLFENSFTIHFMHRWFGVLIFLYGFAFAIVIWRRGIPEALKNSLYLLWGLIALQVVLGVLTIWLHVPVVLASLHQLTALLVFLTSVYLWTLHNRA